jgi:hydrogenase maturation protease
MGARVVGLGQRLAGDDAVGLEIVHRVRALGVPPGVELLDANDAATLLPLLETKHRVFVVDAVVGPGAPGEIVELDAESMHRSPDRPVSTHGIDIPTALALARVLFGSGASPSIRILGVRIAPPTRGSRGLSPAVEAAVARAARILRERFEPK